MINLSYNSVIISNATTVLGNLVAKTLGEREQGCRIAGYF